LARMVPIHHIHMQVGSSHNRLHTHTHSRIRGGSVWEPLLQSREMAYHRPAVLERHYNFEYDVGQWHFGTIRVLRDRDTKELKVCKAIDKDCVECPSTFRTRLNRLQAFEHEHLVRITEVLEDASGLYLISDYQQGGDLQDWMDNMDNNHVLQESACATYMRQTLLALAHCHAEQVYHGHLTPRSLMLSTKLPNAEIKVCDCGYADILDPDGGILLDNVEASYIAPEVLSEPYLVGAAADIWSLGAIAHKMLTGATPDQAPSGESGWGLRRMSLVDAEEVWDGRSDLCRDFVHRCLRRAEERPTAAKLLSHPWLKGSSPLTAKVLRSNDAVAREVRHKTLCYSLLVILLPALTTAQDFEKLRKTMMKLDDDHDGFLSMPEAERILWSRCSKTLERETLKAALSIVDVTKTDVVDLCGIACAELLLREFFSAGYPRQPLTATELAPLVLKRFFEEFGSRHQQGPAVTVVGRIKAKIRTTSLRSIEIATPVRYQNLLECLPEDEDIDSQALTTLLCSNAGYGTPLGQDSDTSPMTTTTQSQSWSLTGSGGLFEFVTLFQSCGVGAKREESPQSIRIS